MRKLCSCTWPFYSLPTIATGNKAAKGRTTAGFLIFPLLLSLFTFTSCVTEDIDAQAVIAEKVATRIAGFEANFRQDCRDKVLEAARLRADSLLIERARRMRVIAGRPPKPRRPGSPPPMELTEELPLRPLFPFEIRFDTILRDSLYQDSLRLDSLMLLQLDSLRLDSIERAIPPKRIRE